MGIDVLGSTSGNSPTFGEKHAVVPMGRLLRGTMSGKTMRDLAMCSLNGGPSYIIVGRGLREGVMPFG
jgi:hypothetical protein